MNLEINVDTNELAYSLATADQGELVNLILVTDSIIAEVEFTERVVLNLVRTLNQDLDSNEKAALLSKITKLLA